VTIELGALGAQLHSAEATPEQAVEIEKAGYGALWLMVSPPADLKLVERVLDVTERIVVGTGIVNMWTAGATTVAASYHRIEARHPNRFLLGIGAGHREVDRDYTSPYDTLVAYLDALAAAGVPADRTVLAALGPRMLRLARDRAGGTKPAMITPEHTRRARETLGADRLVLPGVHVVLDADVERARALGRTAVTYPAAHVSNYAKNLRRLGFTDADLAEPGSDRLVDALVVHGDEAAVAAGLRAHLDAGADHVGVSPLGDDPMATLHAIAGALL
jgi:probable F420-dependent oxidoreductase